jgi:hypothetical protein
MRDSCDSCEQRMPAGLFSKVDVILALRASAGNELKCGLWRYDRLGIEIENPAYQLQDGLRPELVRLLEQSRISALVLESTNVDFRNCDKRPITERDSIAPAADDEGILSVSEPSKE